MPTTTTPGHDRLDIVRGALYTAAHSRDGGLERVARTTRPAHESQGADGATDSSSRPAAYVSLRARGSGTGGGHRSGDLQAATTLKSAIQDATEPRLRELQMTAERVHMGTRAARRLPPALAR
jgi:hypothetical protein